MMKGLKKLNLLPVEIKNKYANKYFKLLAIIIAAVMLLVIGVQAVNAGILTLQINQYNDRNAKYEQEKRNIEELQNRIVSYNTYIREYEQNVFPFGIFMNELETIRPENVYIISVDTPDRLINEGNKSDKTKENETEEKSDDGLERIKDVEPVSPEIKYVDDLTGKEIVIRGYSKKQDEISTFIFGLSTLSYITDAKITAIEEHVMLDGQEYNIFEIVVKGGTCSEDNNAG